jgi:hypothetical protein
VAAFVRKSLHPYNTAPQATAAAEPMRSLYFFDAILIVCYSSE